MSLRAEGISFGYRRDRVILREVTAQATAGRVTALIGPNAAGKTTLLRVLAGVLQAQRGRVLLDGKRLGDFDIRERAKRVAYVAQRATVDAPFSVRDVLELGGYWMGRAARLRTDWAIERCELGGLVDGMFHELSVGQQQRVALARMLVQLEGGRESGVALLDEPMSAMDPKHIERTGVLLRELAAGGTTVVVVLHDLGLAGMLADDVWALAGGELVAEGPIGATLEVGLLKKMYGTEFRLRETGGGVMAEPRYDFEARSREEVVGLAKGTTSG